MLNSACCMQVKYTTVSMEYIHWDTDTKEDEVFRLQPASWSLPTRHSTELLLLYPNLIQPSNNIQGVKIFDSVLNLDFLDT